MNKNSTYSTNLSLKHIDTGLLFLRISIGIMMLLHGIPKLKKFFSEEANQFADPFGIGAEASLGLTVFSEVICSVLILIGLGTRLATIPLIITMFTAHFIIHAADPFKVKELSLLFMVVYLFLFLAGAGKYSLDYFLMKKKQNKQA